LFEELPLINSGRRSDAQALAPVQQNNLIGKFRRQTQIVGDLNDGIAMLVRKTAKAAEQFDLGSDIEM
jgi:hypothetical protein